LRRFIWIGIGLFLLLDTEVSWGSLWGKNRKGNKLYEKGQYDEALKVYKDAQLESPESPQLHYNIGNALYQKRKFKEAAQEYEKALRSDRPLLQEGAYYNLGNSAYRQGKLTDAIQYYEKTLQLKPDDMDAKYNLEFVRKKLKETAQKQPPKNQGNQQEKSEKGQKGREEQKKSQQAKKQQQPKEAEQPKEKKSEQAKELKQSQGKKEGQENPEPSPPQKGMMSKEEAQRLLDALKEQEKKDQKELRRVKTRGQTKVEKDW